jgi:hypothetical protein
MKHFYDYIIRDDGDMTAEYLAADRCPNCGHKLESVNRDGSCGAYGYNGVDCQAQPCFCRSHIRANYETR